jgi:hypothetical protein
MSKMISGFSITYVHGYYKDENGDLKHTTETIVDE